MSKQAASIVYSVIRSDAVQNILCWLTCYVHKRPPSPKFQILPSQLRQTEDRAPGLCLKSLGGGHWQYSPSLSGPFSSYPGRSSIYNGHGTGCSATASFYGVPALTTETAAGWIVGPLLLFILCFFHWYICFVKVAKNGICRTMQIWTLEQSFFPIYCRLMQ